MNHTTLPEPSPSLSAEDLDGLASALRALQARAGADDWEALARRLHPALSRLCRRVAGPVLGDDALQETWLRLRQQVGHFRTLADGPDADRAALGWVLTLAMRTALNCRRSAQRHQAWEQAAATSLAVVSEATALDSPLEQLSLSERDGILARCLEELPQRFRDPILLHVVSGLGYSAVASTMAMPVGTAKSNVHRGLQALRLQLERRGVSLSLLGLWSSLQDGSLLPGEAASRPSSAHDGRPGRPETAASAPYRAPLSLGRRLSGCGALGLAVVVLALGCQVSSAADAPGHETPSPPAALSATASEGSHDLASAVGIDHQAHAGAHVVAPLAVDALTTGTFTDQSLSQLLELLKVRLHLSSRFLPGVDWTTVPDYRLSCVKTELRVHDLCDAIAQLGNASWRFADGTLVWSPAASVAPLRTVMDITQQMNVRAQLVFAGRPPVSIAASMQRLDADAEYQRLEHMHALAVAGPTGEAGAQLIMQMDARLEAIEVAVQTPVPGAAAPPANPAVVMQGQLAADVRFQALSHQLAALQHQHPGPLTTSTCQDQLYIVVPQLTLPPHFAQ